MILLKQAVVGIKVLDRGDPIEKNIGFLAEVQAKVANTLVLKLIQAALYS